MQVIQHFLQMEDSRAGETDTGNGICFRAILHNHNTVLLKIILQTFLPPNITEGGG